ncbi:N-formylglutamate deformylase [Vibrio quintilis]|uniref:N-formylglutamate amidohydrolase n=1 Tax=Vibrio quintilis TaxID=1117707 RepID=A0A1M7YS41_9VIBR|nr:N-formylglutamate deformylase [Vibrio quintilis]SHO55395.1 N-formylglutamate amidohydrolase [Vibrio quintilis]
MEAFQYYPGTSPLLISIPHAGIHLTPAVEAGLSETAKSLPDTDWHVPKLYEFARQTGAHVLIANYSRFVIDLNRPADDQPLYTTATTGLFPQTLFDGTPIFSAGNAPSNDDRAAYLTNIWQPYHMKIQDTLTHIKEKFGYALLFDAHSIASNIPRLFDGQLPDLNIGTNQEQSCAPALQKAVEAVCQNQDTFSWVLNGRFKGGYITRAYGRPEQGWHAIQLELAQCNYMEETPPFNWREEKAAQLIPVLKTIISQYTKSAESGS